LFGFSAWILLGHFSPIYAVVNCLWCIVFTEYWKHQEVDLAIRWGVRGVSKIELQRKEFKYQKEITDPVTGQKVRFFPSTTRLWRQLLQIPFALGAALVLGSLIATCFGIEIFISEIYDGPLKSVLVCSTTLIGKIYANQKFRYSCPPEFLLRYCQFSQASSRALQRS
jgi:anoctamin-10